MVTLYWKKETIHENCPLLKQNSINFSNPLHSSVIEMETKLFRVV